MIHWHSEAVRRAGLTDEALVALSDNDTAAVVAAWRANLTPARGQSVDYPTHVVEAIVRRHPHLFRQS